jgi:gamma-glutamyl-gamma-aminobutyrate hydrolase PuuD
MPFKVLIVNGNKQYETMFQERGWEVTHDFSEADAIQFTGGADITPSIYGFKPHRTTRSDSSRDLEEMGMYIRAINKPKMGICRGAQLLFALNGGRVLQDVNNHTRNHPVVVSDQKSDFYDDRVEVTSTHHQQMSYREGVRDNKDAVLLAYSRGLTTIIEDKAVDNTIDTEAVFFPGTKTLCFQPHPEFGPGPCQDLYFDFIKNHIEPYIYQG